MKKILLFLSALVACQGMFAQNQTNEKQTISPNSPNYKSLDVQAYTQFLKERTNKTRGGSRNYSYVDAMGRKNGDNFDTQISYLWEDSTMKGNYGGTQDYIWLRSFGQVFDPMAPAYNDIAEYQGEILVSSTDAYVLDSVGFLYAYTRNPSKTSIVDTLILDVTYDAAGATSGTDLIYYWEPGSGTPSWVKTKTGYDSVYIAAVLYDISKLEILSGGNHQTHKIPLTTATEIDTTSGGWNYTKVATNMNVPPGGQVGVTASFKTGDTWTPYVDSLGSSGNIIFNRVSAPSLIEGGGSTFRFVENIDMNWSSLGRTDTSGWGTVMIPSIYFVNPFFDYHVFDFDVTCNTCILVANKDVVKFQDFGVYPNPVSNAFNIEFNVTQNIDNLDMTVFANNGQVINKINKMNINSGQVIREKINMENLPSGIYYVRINADGQLTTKKVIKD